MKSKIMFSLLFTTLTGLWVYAILKLMCYVLWRIGR